MKWEKQVWRYWDIGEEKPFFTFSQKKLSSVMMALIRCDGKIHDCYCAEKEYGSPRLTCEPRYCGAVLRISLPCGAEPDFEKISGMKLTKVPVVSIS